MALDILLRIFLPLEASVVKCQESLRIAIYNSHFFNCDGARPPEQKATAKESIQKNFYVGILRDAKPDGARPDATQPPAPRWITEQQLSVLEST